MSSAILAMTCEQAVIKSMAAHDLHTSHRSPPVPVLRLGQSRRYACTAVVAVVADREAFDGTAGI